MLQEPSTKMPPNILIKMLILIYIPNPGQACGWDPSIRERRLTAEQNSFFIFDFLDNTRDDVSKQRTSVYEISALPRFNNENVLFSLFAGQYVLTFCLQSRPMYPNVGR